MALPEATLHVKADHLSMEGTIDPVCWDYAIKLSPADLRDFLRLLAQPTTAQFLAEKGGVLAPFIVGLIAVAPRLIWQILTRRSGAVAPQGEG
ncbi:MAG: hypothetical protein ACHP7N_15160 [Caulobacterales bacterium]